MKKTFIFILGFILTIGLTTTLVFASDLEKSSDANSELPYLTPNLDDAKLYLLATEIQENTRATSSTYDIDDIYNMLVSIRSYLGTSNSNTSSILTELQDLTGNGTAYNTHSMLMDMWMRIGGNSSLGNTYTIIDMLKDIDDVLNNSLISTDGNETYNITELLAGIYGIYATPRSIPDLYDRLVLLDAKIQNIEDYTSYISGDAYTIADAVSRLADIYASNDVVAAKQAQQQYEDESIADFTGSGTGAATTANKNDIKGISSTVKQGLNTGGSASNALGVFSFDTSNEWSWFTTTTKNNLDTVTIPEPQYTLIQELNVDYYDNTHRRWSINQISKDTKLKVEVTLSSTLPSSRTLQLLRDRTGEYIGIGTLNDTDTHFVFYPTQSIYPYVDKIGFNTSVSNTIYVNIKIYSEIEQTRKSFNNNIVPDFITNRDKEYFNLLNGNK